MGEGYALVPIFVIVFLACPGQAAAPVSPPDSRFVWEPGENLTFIWTTANFDGFYYDPENGVDSEILTIRIDGMKNRTIPEGGLVYSTTVGKATARYRPFGEYAVIGFMGEKYLAGFPMGKSNITSRGGISLSPLYRILVDENTNHILSRGSTLALNEGYVLEIRDLNAVGAQVVLSLKKEGIEVDTKTIDTGNNYVYEIRGRPVIAVHIDSIIKENETFSTAINGIFQASEQYTRVNERDIFGLMKINKVSDTGITMSNILPINLNRGSIIKIIGSLKLKIADSDTTRIHLYSDCGYENNEHRGAARSKELSSWDGMNYAGFWYDVDSGNYSESLEITNITGRTIPEGGLTYTSYRIRMLYPVTSMKRKKPPGTDGSYLRFNLWGNNYVAKGNGFAKILLAQEDCIYDKKTLSVGTDEKNGDIWELGEGYNLTAMLVNFSENPYKAQLLLSRNGIVLDDIWLQHENVYSYALPGKPGYPKLITYLDAVFSGSNMDMIQLRYTWFVSDNVTRIKEGDRFGVFNVTALETDRIIFTNKEPIELKAGSIINLFGNFGFFVENSNELKFYPTNRGDAQMMPEEVTVNEAPHDVTIPVGTSPAERIAGFEVIISLAAIIAFYKIKGRKNG